MSGRLRLGHALLGAGIAAKIWPGVLLPLTVAYVWRTRGRREALVCLAVSVGVVVAVVLPFFVVSPHGVWTSFSRQLSRPLQIESIGAALIVASHHVFGTGATMVSSRGSQNISGTFASAVGVLQSLVQLGVLVGIWFAFARRDRSREELVRYAAAAVVAFIALGKVLSPQFLIWLIPLVPLVRRWSVAILYRRRARADPGVVPEALLELCAPLQRGGDVARAPARRRADRAARRAPVTEPAQICDS